MSNELVPLNELERMAATIAKSGLFGVKTADQAMALMLVAQSENLHPMTAVQEFDIIQGRPARKSWSMLSRFQRAGGSVEWHERSDTKASATFSHPAGGTVKVDWDLERAKKAGLSGKDNWHKWPRQMLTARVISEGVRTVYPGATGGFYTPEETRDMDDLPAPRPQRQTQKVEVIDATTGEVTEARVPVQPAQPLVEPTSDNPFGFPPSDGGAGQPELQPQKDPDAEREQHEASGNHVLKRITSFKTPEEVVAYTKRYEATINQLPADIRDMCWNEATAKLKALGA